MEKVITGLLVLVGIIHLLPVSGVLGLERLVALYGVPLGDPNLEILMRHRAVLFGLLGLFLVYAAFKPSLQALAIIAGCVSVVSFIVIAWSVGGYNDSVRKVVIADLIAIVALVAAPLKAMRPSMFRADAETDTAPSITFAASSVSPLPGNVQMPKHGFDQCRELFRFQ